MTISVGDKLPEATLLKLGADGPEPVSLSALTKGRNVVIFGLPGAFTTPCTMAHVPSFIRTRAGFDAKGVDEVICVAVNDPFVMKAWGDSTGATAARITMLADAQSELTGKLGLAFDAPPIGLMARSRRYAMQVVDGVVTVMHLEQDAGGCEISGGEAMLAAI